MSEDRPNPQPAEPESLALPEPRPRSTPWLLRLVLMTFVLLAGLLGYILYLFGPTGKSAQEIGRAHV